MNTPIRPLNDVRRTLDIDLVADFTCPWSWLGMAQLTRALGNLSGDVETRLRWHPFRMASPNANTAPRSFHDYLAERLPAGHQRAVCGEEPGRGRARTRTSSSTSRSSARCRAPPKPIDWCSSPPTKAGMRTWRRRFSARISNAARTSATSRVLEKIGAEAGLDREDAQDLPRDARRRDRCSRAAKSACAVSACARCPTCCSAGGCSCLAR